MKIEVLGMGCPTCQVLYDNVRKAVEELGINAEVTKVEDLDKIINYGIMSTPALVVDGEVKFAGRVLAPSKIKEFFIR